MQTDQLFQRSLLVDLLVKFVMQRFVDLPYKGLERMLKLTPLEQTRAGQELMELGYSRTTMDDFVYGGCSLSTSA